MYSAHLLRMMAMDLDLLLLAIFAVREESGTSRWDCWRAVNNELPGFSGIARSSLYRAADVLLKGGFIKEAGRAPGRARDRQLLRITPAGREWLCRQLTSLDVEVKNLRHSGMSFGAFFDFLVLCRQIDFDIMASLVVKRIASLEVVIQQGMEPKSQRPSETHLLLALKRQAELERLELLHFLQRVQEEQES